MKNEVFKYFKLLFGVMLCSFGVVVILNSNLGLSPWDVLNQGLNKKFGITLGEASFVVGAVVVVFSIFLKQPIGSGTVVNFIAVGLFMDIFIYLDFIPRGVNIFEQILLLVIGLVVFCYGCYLYMATGLGCGPRDGLMMILTKRTKYPLWQVKTVLEIGALGLGYLLDGTVGVGTIISSICVGPMIQYFFKLHHKEIGRLKHRSLALEFKLLKRKILR